jgi:hypothetical protein
MRQFAAAAGQCVPRRPVVSEIMSRASFVLRAATVTAALVGCQATDDGGAEIVADEFFWDCEDAARPPALTVFATDEAFKEFVNSDAASPPTRNDALAPHLTTPATPANLSASVPPTFVFQPTRTAAAEHRPPSTRLAAAPRAIRRNRGLVRWLSSLVEGTAWAHCPAVSGDNFLVRVIDRDTTIYTALLSVTSFTPTAQMWNKALDGRLAHTLTVTIERATFSTGKITLGPYVATTSPMFTVGL